jgi:RNA 3'-terminal phosphate cyclase (ATP)
MKSGKQRRAEIKAKRRATRMPVAPCWVWPPLSYADCAFICRDCQSSEVWTAAQQKWWFEVAHGARGTRAVRCRPCRAMERARVVEARRVSREGMARKIEMQRKLKENMIELDGSRGEGGGQILRTALALSLITGQGFRVDNIRAKRPKPGLMRQHLACVQAAVAVGGGASQTRALSPNGGPVQIGETSLSFAPGPITAGDYEFAVGSAGSCMLVLQTVLWPLLMASAPSTLLLRGGTHNPMAPSLSFLELLRPVFAGPAGDIYTLALRRHGFYPAGGGEVLVQVLPPAGGVNPPQFMQRGELVERYAECLHAGVPKGVAERELAVLKAALGLSDEQLRNRALRSNEGPGNALMVVLRYEHITEVLTSYGDKSVSAEQVARNLVQQVRRFEAAQAPVGEHLADQLLIPLALACVRGSAGQYWASEWSEHARTNAEVVERFLPVRFVVEPKAGGDGVVVSAALCN